MGERVTVGTLTYTVLGTEWHPQIGEGPQAKSPKNRFLAVRVSVTNGGATSSAIPALTLVAANGEIIGEAEGTGLQDWMGQIRRLNAAQTEEGFVVFDAPPASYKLRVSEDSLEQDEHKSALIEIPLQFNSSTGQ